MKSLAHLDVYTPKTVDEALKILDEKAGRLKIVAGGTDLVIQLRKMYPRNIDLLNIYAIDEMRYVKLENGAIKIGALTDFMTISESSVVQKNAPVLADAARSIGSVQILNKASIGGNIVNASPAADSLPALYVLEAELILASRNSVRKIPIADFYKGYKVLDMRPNELLLEVVFPAMKDGEVAMFFKHGLRRGDAISVVNGAVFLRFDGSSHVVEDARVALGAVAPTVIRASETEKILRNNVLSIDVIRKASEATVYSISPIDDVRGSAEYRKEMCINYVYMTLWKIMRMMQA